MKAVTFSEFGGPAAIEVQDLPDPQPAPGQVLVAVAAASINPVDLMVLNGGAATRMPAGATPPYIVGWDLAGHITAVGDGVSADLVGQYVLGFVPWFGKGVGSQRSLVELDADQWAPAPDSIAPEALTTLGLNALTAWQAVDAAAPAPGTTVVVTGATGAVGGYVVEFAARRGATVLAMAAESDTELVTGFGAASVLPRDAADAVAANPAADVVIDTASLGAAVLGVLRDGGRYFTVTQPPESQRGIEVTRVGVKPNAAQLAEIVGLAASGSIALRVEKTYPADEAAAAYADFESGSHRGRIVLVF